MSELLDIVVLSFQIPIIPAVHLSRGLYLRACCHCADAAPESPEPLLRERRPALYINDYDQRVAANFPCGANIAVRAAYVLRSLYPFSFRTVAFLDVPEVAYMAAMLVALATLLAAHALRWLRGGFAAGSRQHPRPLELRHALVSTVRLSLWLSHVPMAVIMWWRYGRSTAAMLLPLTPLKYYLVGGRSQAGLFAATTSITVGRHPGVGAAAASAVGTDGGGRGGRGVLYTSRLGTCTVSVKVAGNPSEAAFPEAAAAVAGGSHDGRSGGTGGAAGPPRRRGSSLMSILGSSGVVVRGCVHLIQVVRVPRLPEPARHRARRHSPIYPAVGTASGAGGLPFAAFEAVAGALAAAVRAPEGHGSGGGGQRPRRHGAVSGWSGSCRGGSSDGDRDGGSSSDEEEVEEDQRSPFVSCDLTTGLVALPAISADAAAGGIRGDGHHRSRLRHAAGGGAVLSPLENVSAAPRLVAGRGGSGGGGSRLIHVEVRAGHVLTAAGAAATAPPRRAAAADRAGPPRQGLPPKSGRSSSRSGRGGGGGGAQVNSNPISAAAGRSALGGGGQGSSSGGGGDRLCSWDWDWQWLGSYMSCGACVDGVGGSGGSGGSGDSGKGIGSSGSSGNSGVDAAFTGGALQVSGGDAAGGSSGDGDNGAPFGGLASPSHDPRSRTASAVTMGVVQRREAVALAGVPVKLPKRGLAGESPCGVSGTEADDAAAIVNGDAETAEVPLAATDAGFTLAAVMMGVYGRAAAGGSCGCLPAEEAEAEAEGLEDMEECVGGGGGGSSITSSESASSDLTGFDGEAGSCALLDGCELALLPCYPSRAAVTVIPAAAAAAAAGAPGAAAASSRSAAGAGATAAVAAAAGGGGVSVAEAADPSSSGWHAGIIVVLSPEAVAHIAEVQPNGDRAPAGGGSGAGGNGVASLCVRVVVAVADGYGSGAGGGGGGGGDGVAYGGAGGGPVLDEVVCLQALPANSPPKHHQNVCRPASDGVDAEAPEPMTPGGGTELSAFVASAAARTCDVWPAAMLSVELKAVPPDSCTCAIAHVHILPPPPNRDGADAGVDDDRDPEACSRGGSAVGTAEASRHRVLASLPLLLTIDPRVAAELNAAYDEHASAIFYESGATDKHMQLHLPYSLSRLAAFRDHVAALAADLADLAAGPPPGPLPFVPPQESSDAAGEPEFTSVLSPASAASSAYLSMAVAAKAPATGATAAEAVEVAAERAVAEAVATGRQLLRYLLGRGMVASARLVVAALRQRWGVVVAGEEVLAAVAGRKEREHEAAVPAEGGAPAAAVAQHQLRPRRQPSHRLAARADSLVWAVMVLKHLLGAKLLFRAGAAPDDVAAVSLLPILLLAAPLAVALLWPRAYGRSRTVIAVLLYEVPLELLVHWFTAGRLPWNTATAMEAPAVAWGFQQLRIMYIVVHLLVQPGLLGLHPLLVAAIMACRAVTYTLVAVRIYGCSWLAGLAHNGAALVAAVGMAAAVRRWRLTHGLMP
ncbi:hypothetical protein GPECTOR_44g88 [Gonium pectorale]|uniref:Uncharacterized protein n=1 Tax=Gonium pectorale TaxID=33097 RepID=A0A150G991_GONPE|nr:hypothetical protein GPECTOR_44g88 [Gonium pectorale]|eukprot:KXZ46414.1 hypothetical protein GPECTOR_44g88 [Gonium pectorale]